MKPLRVEATLRGGIALPRGPMALDSLLAYRVALERGLAPPRHAGECERIEIPIAREPGDRFCLASFSVADVEAHELRWVNRRAPVPEYQALGGTKVRRVQIKSGPDKSYRVPLEVSHVARDTLTWWCLGDANEIRRLLTGVGYLGKKRGVGLGRVVRWTVAECAPWGDGFPVVGADGLPLRPLPLDWPGLAEGAPRSYHTLDFPYWDHTREELCACPSH